MGPVHGERTSERRLGNENVHQLSPTLQIRARSRVRYGAHMVKHILIGVDGSKESLEAARFGQGLAEQTGAALTYVFAIEPPQVIPVGPLSGYVTTSVPHSEEDLHQARKFLDALVADRPAVKAASRVELGKPSETICELANQLGVDLVVVGARGLGAGKRFLLGSVSDRVVHHAPCPVLVVRPTLHS